MPHLSVVLLKMKSHHCCWSVAPILNIIHYWWWYIMVLLLHFPSGIWKMQALTLSFSHKCTWLNRLPSTLNGIVGWYRFGQRISKDFAAEGWGWKVPKIFLKLHDHTMVVVSRLTVKSWPWIFQPIFIFFLLCFTIYKSEKCNFIKKKLIEIKNSSAPATKVWRGL